MPNPPRAVTASAVSSTVIAHGRYIFDLTLNSFALYQFQDHLGRKIRQRQCAGHDRTTIRKIACSLVFYLVQSGFMRTKVTKRGQVSIPSKVRKKLKIGPDTKLEWVVEGNTARVIPLPSDPLKAFRGSGKKGMVRRLLDERRRDQEQENGS
ncbi:AbrB/MazE/SpoVT family DNA-binding domain-containing protein [Acidobacteria bacterium AH-259-A15]|nr:AbrB/MazE/SpoVT family DNA-binding domain-containing protein [Acidobacteria bacterium AH-259-A15]